MHTMHTALDVAKWFLTYNKIMMDSDGAEYISNLKLQKLLYYAQGTFLAVTGFPLFDDAIEAWTHGPVVPAAGPDSGGYGLGAPVLLPVPLSHGRGVPPAAHLPLGDFAPGPEPVRQGMQRLHQELPGGAFAG